MQKYSKILVLFEEKSWPFKALRKAIFFRKMFAIAYQLFRFSITLDFNSDLAESSTVLLRVSFDRRESRRE